MSYLVLARKHRPQTFNQVIAQDHVTRTLSNAITSNRVAHALLFSGPRGTGKTTVARILAKAMNCEKGPSPEPCNQCRSCRDITAGHAVDVFEIDGASNNGVDQVRELRENARYMPAHSPYKIYIIDEVHMLSIPAFNALLKTLEEPPPHVLFFFATTEVHKIPITILSRCQRHDFRRIESRAIYEHLVHLCELEGYEFESEGLWLIAREAGGCVRDSMSLLDQIMACADGKIAYDQTLEVLGIIDRKLIFDMASAMFGDNMSVVLTLLDDIYTRGHDMKRFHSELLVHIRNMLLIKRGMNAEKVIDAPAHEIETIRRQVVEMTELQLSHAFDLMFREEATIRMAANPKLAMEAMFLKMSQIRPTLPVDVLIERLHELRSEILRVGGSPEGGAAPVKSSPPGPPKSAPTSNTERQSAPAAVDNPVPRTDSKPVQMDDTKRNWASICDEISQKHPSLGASLTRCHITIPEPKVLVIGLDGNGFNQNIIMRKNNLTVVKEACNRYFGKEMEIKVGGRKPAPDKRTAAKKKERLTRDVLGHPLTVEAMSVFGGNLVELKVLEDGG